MLKELMLKFTDYEKPFEVHIDASNLAIGGVLMYESHSMVYESHQLNETKRQYLIHKKEMIICAKNEQYHVELLPYS